MKPSLTDTLCTRCGLCCDGTLFADVELASRDEASALEVMGLEIEDAEGGDAGLLLQPCGALKGKRCSIYEHRPDCCRKFECRLLQEVKHGAVGVDQAKATISEALQRIERLRELALQLGPGNERLPLKEHCADVLVLADERKPEPEITSEALGAASRDDLIGAFDPGNVPRWPEVNTARQLGLTSAAALVVASMIGTGVFTTSGFLLADLKSPWLVLAAWVLGGGLATLGALSYGALARRIPESGGEYTFLSQTIHPAAGYLAGWISLLVGFSAPLAAAAIGFGAYARPWLGGLPPRMTGTMLILTCALLHSAHVQRGARIQDWTVLIKVLLIAAFVGYGFVGLPKLEPVATSPVSVSTFAVSLVWVSFSYSGWNAAVYVGGEIREPERNLPRALLLGTGMVTLLYLGLNAVFVFAAPIETLTGKLDIGRVAAAAIGGPALGHAVSGLVALALLTSVSSMTMAGPRVYARMAAVGQLPRCLAAAEGPPRAAIAFQSVIALGLLWSAAYEQLLTFIGFTLGLCAAATVMGLIVLRRREGARLAVPGWPWVPWLFVLSTLAITGFTMFRRPWESAAGLATLGFGWLAWKWADRKRPLGK